MSALSACVCSSIFGNAALIPEHNEKDTLLNITSVSHDGCWMQESHITSESSKVDIEVGIRFIKSALKLEKCIAMLCIS